MTLRLLAPLAALLLAALPAAALDLDQMRDEGRLVSQALALGERGDWDGAEDLVARAEDPVARDIVLWRKLRAGAGTVAEYQSFVSRRGTWPGQEQLQAAVFGDRPGSGRPALSPEAEANWRSFARAWESDDFDAAEAVILRASESRAGLGDPDRWADRRRAIARRAARLGRGEAAYRIAAGHMTGPEIGYAYADLEWIAGWVALRRLNDPARAIEHFERFNAVVETPISLGRGGYWLGRAHEAKGDAGAAAEWYARAARHQTTFYGQLAAEKIGADPDPMMGARDLPDWRVSPVIRGDDVRAAVILHYAGEDALAQQTFAHLVDRLEGPGAVGALARLTLDLEKPHYAVRVAKQAARKGMILYPAYYPVTELGAYARAVEPALAMAIARQETELNPRAISPAGARGLMQLMPGTAKIVSGWIGEGYAADRLLDDWQYNARLGQAYLAAQIDRFGGSYAMAAAAYNAGPHRVERWIGEFGDPRNPRVDMIDWIESIPFNETRDYVQRVMEGIYVYRTRLSGTSGPMTIGADLARGVLG